MTIFRSEALEGAARDFVRERLESRALFKAGKTAASNRAFDRSRESAARLMSDRGGREACLKALADHDEETIALGAAVYLLPIDEVFAMSRLEKLVATAEWPDNVSAEYSIREWRAGNMDDVRALA